MSNYSEILHQDNNGSATTGAKDVATVAKDQTVAVARGAASAGKDVKDEAVAQASAVVGQARDQLGVVVGQAKSEVKNQLDSRGQQAADGLHTLAGQLAALSDGRPQDAGHVGALVNDAQQRVQAYAETLQQRGPQAIAEDLASFARRRPFRFLLAAGVAGFAAGRLARSGAAAAKDAGAGADRESSTFGSLAASHTAGALAPAAAS